MKITPIKHKTRGKGREGRGGRKGEKVERKESEESEEREETGRGGGRGKCWNMGEEHVKNARKEHLRLAACICTATNAEMENRCL